MVGFETHRLNPGIKRVTQYIPPKNQKWPFSCWKASIYSHIGLDIPKIVPLIMTLFSQSPVEGFIKQLNIRDDLKYACFLTYMDNPVIFYRFNSS